MARGVNVSDERLLGEYRYSFKKKEGREPSEDDIKRDFETYKMGYHDGFDRCADAASDPYPD